MYSANAIVILPVHFVVFFDGIFFYLSLVEQQHFSALLSRKKIGWDLV